MADVPEQRTEREHPALSPGERIAEVWAAERNAHGLTTSPSRVRAFAKEAATLLEQGHDMGFLESSARAMSEQATWFSLTKQVEAAPAAVVRRPAGVGGRMSDPAEAAAIAAILARGSGL